MQTKGFTLIELLIVIGIIAILATAVLLVINPAQILAETRDTQRLNDLDVVRSAINLYSINVVNPTFTGVWNCTLSPVAAPCLGATANVVRTTGGAGWVDVNFNSMGGGSPISVLPLDPVGTQTAALHYSFETNNTSKTYEITAQMESAKYVNGGTGDKETPDGGNNANCYEVGNDLTLVGAAEC